MLDMKNIPQSQVTEINSKCLEFYFAWKYQNKNYELNIPWVDYKNSKINKFYKRNIKSLNMSWQTML